MNIIQLFQQQFEQEVITTRKMLSCIPDGKYQWQPHPKSMTLEKLAGHIAELPSWISMTVKTEELDFAKVPYSQPVVKSTKDLLAEFEKNVVDGRAHLKMLNEEILEKTWTLRNGEAIYDVSPKRDVIRMTMSQIIHHRAQLGVFLRLLNVSIPGSYGPSADEDFVEVEQKQL